MGAAGLLGAAAAPVRAQEPILRCEMQTPIRMGAIAPALFVLASNRDGTKIYQDWNSWGYYCRYFTAVAAGDSSTNYVIQKRPSEWDRNAPTTQMLNRGEQLKTAIDLGDGSWSVTPFLRITQAADLRVTPNFRIEPDQEKTGVWTGHIAGPTVKMSLERAAMDALNVEPADSPLMCYLTYRGTALVFVLAANRGPTKVYEEMNSWGYGARFFIATIEGDRDAGAYTIARRPLAWSENVFATKTLQRGQSIEAKFDLCDGSWLSQPRLPEDERKELVVTLTPHFRNDSDERHVGVWTGHIAGQTLAIALAPECVARINATD